MFFYIDPEWHARESVRVLETVRLVASDVVNTTTQALGAGDVLLTVAPSAWKVVTRLLRDVILTAATRMEEARQRTAPDVFRLGSSGWYHDLLLLVWCWHRMSVYIMFVNMFEHIKLVFY
ncbi:hypothetical protein J6590_043572 [Homalodisca vitripennis]|nr:hypothetical protein J6590_043572 [Homalodisca vitripennis]